ncbi:MAG TPA: selenide, water dikinase SelD [Tetragenococcus sp.]|nr:selenide, water dikinase SelD [Tetragenococcus sp.]
MEDFLSSCTSGGCGAKIGAKDLAGLLQDLPRKEDEHLQIGFDSADDAAVYRLNEEQSLISTTDFFSPMVADPKTFGAIAATNALSDIYAMGGRPLYALNIVCFPERLPKEELQQMLLGGAEKVLEANATLAGGHSIYDHEPKYGLAVTGIVANDQIIQNNTPQKKDVLILTKALGVGLVQAAVRVDLADQTTEQAAITSMQRLNKYAAEKMQNYQVHACTDVTGFGFLGHLTEMVGQHHTAVIDTSLLPLLPQAYHFAKEYLATAGGQRNREFLGDKVSLAGITPAMQEILFDPQTSGGLLISAAAADATELLAAIQKDDPAARIVGEIVEKENEAIVLL